MSFDTRLEPVRYVFAAFEGLVTNVLNHIEPLGQLYLLCWVVVAQRLDHNIDERIHQHGEDRDAHNLNYDTHNFLAD